MARFVGFSARRGQVKLALRLAAMVLIALSLINWQSPVEQAGGSMGGLDVIIAIDVSNSMMATDLQPNRMEKARLFASKLMDTLQGNRVGIVAFAGDAFVQLPLTTDIAAARIYLQSVNTGLVPTQGTNLFEALETCRQAFDPTEKKYKAVVLITDGEEHDAKAMSAAKNLQQEGIVLLTVGAGSAKGATMPTETGELRTNDKGEVVLSKLNEALLLQLAKSTKGSYEALADVNTNVASVLEEINSLDKKTISNSRLINYKSWSHGLIALALLLLLADLLLPARGGVPRFFGKKQRALAAAIFALCFAIQSNGWAQAANPDLRKANQAYLDKDFAQAKKLYEQVLKTDPKNPNAQYNLGNMAYRNKQYGEAAAHYKAAAAGKSNVTTQAGAYNNAGLSHANAEEPNLPKAIESFKQSLRQNPNDAAVRNNLYRALEEWKKQQQQQQNQPDTNPQKKPPPNNKFDQKKAKQKLEALQQEEKRIREKMNKAPAGGTGNKDW
jgi:Ca-activated chloride channel family protein